MLDETDMRLKHTVQGADKSSKSELPEEKCIFIYPESTSPWVRFSFPFGNLKKNSTPTYEILQYK